MPFPPRSDAHDFCPHFSGHCTHHGSGGWVLRSYVTFPWKGKGCPCLYFQKALRVWEARDQRVAEGHPVMSPSSISNCPSDPQGSRPQGRASQGLSGSHQGWRTACPAPRPLAGLATLEAGSRWAGRIQQAAATEVPLFPLQSELVLEGIQEFL